MEDRHEQSSWTAPLWSLVVLGIILCCTIALGGYFLVREHKQAEDLAANNLKLAATLSQVQSQLGAVSDKLNALAAAPTPAAVPAPEERPSAMPEPRHVKAKPRMTARRATEDPRWKQVQEQLSDQQKQLASTREEVEKTRTDLQGSLSSTREELNGSITRSHDELSGSIARTHEELVTLEKRGERSYFEFQLDKSKDFQRVGPISLSLRKVDFKKKHYDLAMMVDDFQLQKKSVNLFEPIWITLSDRPQPVELVVNEIHKDEIKGYISEPKYKKSELAAAAAPAGKPQ